MQCAPPLSFNITKTHSYYYGTLVSLHRTMQRSCQRSSIRLTALNDCLHLFEAFEIDNPGNAHPAIEAALVIVLRPSTMRVVDNYYSLYCYNDDQLYCKY
jgi:hypothetical protein